MKVRALLDNAGKAPAGSRWQRYMRRVGHPLALFAIVFQLALLFSHHHFDLSGEDRFGNVPIADALLLTKQANPTPDDSRPDQAPATPAHTPCFLCTAIHAPASLDTGAPALMLPVVYGRHAGSHLAGSPIMPPRRVAAFDSRGPPRA